MSTSPDSGRPYRVTYHEDRRLFKAMALNEHRVWVTVELDRDVDAVHARCDERGMEFEGAETFEEEYALYCHQFGYIPIELYESSIFVAN